MSDVCMTVVDQGAVDGFHNCLTKCPGTINHALGQSSLNENGEAVDTQCLRVEHGGAQIDLQLVYTNVASCRLNKKGQMPLHVVLPGGQTVIMTLDVKVVGDHIGGWVRTTHENFALLGQSLVTR